MTAEWEEQENLPLFQLWSVHAYSKMVTTSYRDKLIFPCYIFGEMY